MPSPSRGWDFHWECSIPQYGLQEGLLHGLLPFQMPSAAAAAKWLQSSPTLRPHRWQPTRLPHPWDSPGKNTGVGCHFLLQCMKVKSESEVSQWCLLRPWDFPGKSTGVGCHCLLGSTLSFTKCFPPSPPSGRQWEGLVLCSASSWPGSQLPQPPPVPHTRCLYCVLNVFFFFFNQFQMELPFN